MTAASAYASGATGPLAGTGVGRTTRKADTGAVFHGPAAPITVAALYVYSDGSYAELPHVELWGEERDARLYGGPYPVVAHPPCKAWSLMSNCRPEIVKDEDGGMFEAALNAVRTFGGVLEHPAHTRAWKRYGLPKPAVEGWTRSLTDDGWTCAVDQRHYGHEANKPTWLYCVGPKPPELVWGRAPRGDKTVGRSWGQGRDRKRSGTPAAFRDLLLSLARAGSETRMVSPSLRSYPYSYVPTVHDAV